MKNLLITTIIILGLENIFSQPLSVVAGIDKDNFVTIKWFSNHQFNVEGVNIYKREVGANEWIKLNQTPIKRSNDISNSTRDTTLLFYNALTYNKPKDPEDEGTWRIAIITTGILDPKFAEFYGMQYVDKEIESGKTYEYKIVRVENGQEKEGSISNQVKIEQYKQPQPPTGLITREDENSVKFLWTHDKKKFFAYNLYRSDSKQGKKVKINKHPIMVFEFKDEAGKSKRAEQFFIDTNLVSGKTYYYELTGFDYLGRESLPSEEIAATTKDKTPPAEAFDVKVSVKSDSVILSWKVQKEKDLKEINIYRGKQFDGEFIKINKSPLKINVEKYVDVLDKYEPAYFYSIETVDLSGNSTRTFPTAVVITDSKPPAQPKDLEAVGEVGRVVLKWKNNTESDLLGYFVWRSMSGKEDDFLLLNPDPTPNNTYIDSLNKEINNIITYRIKAVDTNYNESPYSKTVNVRMIDVTPPDKPILLKVSNQDLKVKLEWLRNYEPNLAGYDVFYAEINSDSVFNKANREFIKTTSYEFDLASSGDYKFYIVAIDSSGNISENSDTLECSIFYQVPLNKNVSLSGFFDPERKVSSLRWNKIDLASGFVVYKRDKNEDLSAPISNFITENQFEDPQGEKDRYYYFIRIYDNDGNSYDSDEIIP
ncbi:MAG: hypothetical protein NZM09_04710 [Ignavibacterium sp.]|nr:hypothetical protein [Ignavibacterium sp.]MDW8374977.1 hypothetical protein [Ignavibacteriales bacterium]